MTPAETSEREAILARLSLTRAEISHLLEPSPEADGAQESAGPRGAAEGFPRSRTMRALMSGRGMGAVGAVAGGLLLARPRLAWRLLKILPTSAVTRAIVARVVGALGSRR